MKKKFLSIFVIFCVITISQVHALGLGVQGNFYLNFNEVTVKDSEESDYGEEEEGYKISTPKFGFSLLVSPTRQLHFSGSYYFNDQAQIIGLTGDFCPEAFNWKLFGSGMTLLSNPNAWSFNFGFGLGAFVNIWIIGYDVEDEDITIKRTDVSGGLRIPVGFSLNLANGLFEIFTNVAPSVGIRFGGDTPFADWFFPIAVGARIWL